MPGKFVNVIILKYLINVHIGYKTSATNLKLIILLQVAIKHISKDKVNEWGQVNITLPLHMVDIYLSLQI